MPTLRIEYHTEAERLQIERLLAFHQDMTRIADEVPDLEVIDQLEQTALTTGREAIRSSFESALARRNEKLEEKGGRRGRAPAPARAVKKADTRGRS